MLIYKKLQVFNQCPDWVLIVIAGIPAIFFYYFLFKTTFNLPINDDYSLLNFVNHFSLIKGLLPKLNYIINFQHNEYKLIFVNAVFAIQYGLLGYIDFAVLSIVGNIFVVIIYILTVRAFKIPAAKGLTKLFLLLPIGLLLFQLQYASTLNFSMAGIQNISVLAFTLTAISMLANNSRIGFIGACISLLFAICASGNGFLLIPVGVLLLIERKRWAHIFIWITLSIVIALVYFVGYRMSSSIGSSEDGLVIKIFSQINAVYILAFIGSSIAKYQNHFPSVVFGIFLLFIWAIALKNKYSLQNPSVFYFFIFILLTSIAVSIIRSGLGVEQSLASRYGIYSNLVLILTYIFLMETYFEKIISKKIQYGIISLGVLFSTIFFLLSNAAGYRFLQGRQIAVTHELMTWKSEVLHENIKLYDPLESQFDPAVTRHLELGIYKPVTPVLLESTRLGVYKPTENPSQ